MKKRIALLFAMEAEAAPVIAALTLSETPLPKGLSLPFRWYQGAVGNLEILLSVNGKDPRHGVDNIGTEPAACAALMVIHHFKPNALGSCGTAGSFADLGVAVGDVFLSDRFFYYHDHRIPLGAFEPYGSGAFPAMPMTQAANALKLKQGDVSSGNSLDFTPADLDRIRRSGARLKEMEAAGVAWVCYSTGTPCFAIKAVTNLVDPNVRSEAEFEKNFAIATTALTHAVPRVIAYFAEHGF